MIAFTVKLALVLAASIAAGYPVGVFLCWLYDGLRVKLYRLDRKYGISDGMREARHRLCRMLGI